MKQIITIYIFLFSMCLFVQGQKISYSQNTLSKLEDNDSISIVCHSIGCFRSSILKLTITKESTNFVSRLYNMSPHFSTKGKLLKVVTLTEKNIDDFVRFENELNNVKGGGCTTVDLYDIKSKHFNKNTIDGSCNWNGFYYLKKSFFGDSL